MSPADPIFLKSKSIFKDVPKMMVPFSFTVDVSLLGILRVLPRAHSKFELRLSIAPKLSRH